MGAAAPAHITGFFAARPDPDPRRAGAVGGTVDAGSVGVAIGAGLSGDTEAIIQQVADAIEEGEQVRSMQRLLITKLDSYSDFEPVTDYAFLNVLFPSEDERTTLIPFPVRKASRGRGAV